MNACLAPRPPAPAGAVSHGADAHRVSGLALTETPARILRACSTSSTKPYYVTAV